MSGVRAVEIRLCSALTGGNCFPSAGTAAQGVSVINGVFKTTFTIPSGVDLSAGRWFLELAVGTLGGTLNTLSPREELTAIPYAIYASSASRLLGTIMPSQVSAGILDTSVIAQAFSAGSISTEALADGAVTSAKLQNAAVGNAKLAPNAVDSSKLADAAVATAKLATDAVTTGKILPGAVDTFRLARDAVDSEKILNGAVIASKLATGAVNTTKLNDDAVITAKLLNSAVTTPKIAPGAIDESRLADGAVTINKLGVLVIDTTKVRPDAITTSAILNQAVTLPKIALNSIDTARLANDAVTASKILDGAVGTNKIAKGAIDTARLNAAAVTGEKMALGALMLGGRGIDRLGAMTRMGSITSLGTLNLNIGARRHVEVFIHVPPLLSSTDLRIRFNGLGAGSYAVTRSTGAAPYSDINAAGIDMLGPGLFFPVGAQLHVRLVIDGNSGTPNFVTGSFQATAFLGTSIAPVSISGGYGVNMAGQPVTDLSIMGVSAALPAGSYVVAYGEEFP